MGRARPAFRRQRNLRRLPLHARQIGLPLRCRDIVTVARGLHRIEHFDHEGIVDPNFREAEEATPALTMTRFPACTAGDLDDLGFRAADAQCQMTFAGPLRIRHIFECAFRFAVAQHDDAAPRRDFQVNVAVAREHLPCIWTRRRKRERFAIQNFGKHLRGLFVALGGKDPIPTYLPDSLSEELPMYTRLRARLVAEVRMAEDQYESHPAALKVLALGRVVERIKR